MSQAPELRFDRLTETWVAVVPARAAATAPTGTSLPEPAGLCPFCPGNETETEHETARWPAQGDWLVRAVLNRYPIVVPDAERAERSTSSRVSVARGVHELIIESRSHSTDLGDFTDAEAALVARAYRDRARALASLPDTREVVVFRNRGRRAGSSQPHPHCQLASLPLVAPATERRYAIARAFADAQRAPLVQRMLEEELEARERVLEEGADFVLLCPWAAHRRYEMWVVPRVRIPSLAALDDARLPAFGRALCGAVARLQRATGGVDYNFIVRQPPTGVPDDEAASCFFEIAPRTGGPAGFELASGIDIVVLTPEQSADALRRAEPKE